MVVSAYESTRSRRPEIQCRHPHRRENLKSQCRHVILLFSDAVTTDGMYRRMTHGRVIVNNESRVVCKEAIVASAAWIVRKQRVKGADCIPWLRAGSSGGLLSPASE
jgi:hypothetical protein